MTSQKRALDRLTEAARVEYSKGPDGASLDWSRMEERLIAEIARSAEVRRPARKSHWAGARFAMAAAGVLLVLSGSWVFGESVRGAITDGAWIPETVRPDAPAENGDLLPVGAVVETREGTADVNHAGRARWQLGPLGRARVGAQGPYLTVVLESGWLEAEVVPGPAPERFAVEVGRVRIAVKGTRFRVEPLQDQIRVVVARGAVVVGEVGHPGNTQGFLLRGPGVQVFDGSGLPVISAPQMPSDADSSTRLSPSMTALPAEPHGENATRLPRSVASSMGSSLSDRVSPQELALLGERITGYVGQCFRQHTPERKKVRVRAESRVSFVVDPAGTLRELTLQPPLAPAVELCAREAVRAEILPRSQYGGSGTVDLWLVR